MKHDLCLENRCSGLAQQIFGGAVTPPCAIKYLQCHQLLKGPIALIVICSDNLTGRCFSFRSDTVTIKGNADWSCDVSHDTVV